MASRLLLTLAIGLAGGGAFAAAGVPLAWVLGAMVATITAALGGARLAVPPGLRAAMIVVLGILLGSSFTPDIAEHVARWWRSLLGLAGFMLTAGGLGTLLLRRVAGYDPVTAYFTAMPGGLSEMVAMGAAHGGQERIIALSHGLRIVFAVLSVPLWFRLVEGYVAPERPLMAVEAAGGWDWLLLAACALGAPLGRRLGLPAAALVGPLVLSAGLHLAGWVAVKPPDLLIAAAQVVIGSSIGAGFTGSRPRELLRIARYALLLSASSLGSAVLFAWAVAGWSGLDTRTLVLAYAPGGLAEMSLVALALSLDAAFVATHHLVRVLAVVLAAPAVFRALRR
ncbi:MAG TPA: AbrB family transcriptional regulator [Alphaproteobacteria bacterium]|nr:AbrB family transcriptional regulator [Alphaproteobacteria bacterium]